MEDETLTGGERSELLNTLDELMREHPGWRIGQLVSNIAFLARQSDTAAWDVENEEFLQVAREHLQRIAERRATVQVQETPAMRQKVAA